MSMFCFQCQEAAKGTGCTIKGVCGKDETLSAEMDKLLYLVKEISIRTTLFRSKGAAICDEVNHFIVDALFATITNANFDKQAILDRIHKGEEYLEKLNNKASDFYSKEAFDTALEVYAPYKAITEVSNEDVRSLKELVIYGVKGLAAYVEHAYNLDKENTDIYVFMQEAISEISRKEISVDALIALVLKTGEYGVKGMALLDEANTSRYGNPEITKVNIGVRNNPAILISGHDLKDIEELLEQTQGTGIDVYTHSEMLPAHYYPKFKQYSHFVGNYGSAWWKQREDFTTFNGPILFTTNCIVPPTESATYRDRIYTTGSSGYPGCKHIPAREAGKAKDFSQIIEHAKRCQAPTEIETGEIIGGFAHAQVLALAGQVVDAVKSGAIRKFVVMAGCDGRMNSRGYYTDFAQQLPNDTVILTAGCAKYRYNKLNLGDINGIPRLLDAGQCNDSYSLALIALKLKEVFELEDINQLPIVYNIAWYEQKAVIVLLALLHLGVKNINLGPTLPAFLSPNVRNVLIQNFGIGTISDVESDLKKWNLL
ncbi:MAG: hydroxylamine reductase [Tannerellaceae bacterium]